jgi:inner membrane protein
MDNLAHSLVGLTAAKAGLERLSPLATTVCVVSANIADADFLTLFFGDRWTLLQHHRGITHSIAGTVAIGLLVPLLAVAIERFVLAVRGGKSRLQLQGLLIASMITAITHPLLDWTNNYGVRPLLPWSGRWFYGDLVFIVDPYIWLLLGTVAFLLTSKTKLRIIAWSLLAVVINLAIWRAAARSGADAGPLKVAAIVWIAVTVAVGCLRIAKVQRHLGRGLAIAALASVAAYWGALAIAHRAAYQNAQSVANRAAGASGEQLIRVAAMPTVATPFRWQSVAETNESIYRFSVGTEGGQQTSVSVARYEKPTGAEAQLVSIADRDRRAQALLGFARFPLARAEPVDCVGQALVQFADLRYTEPGAARGNFSVNIPIDCPTR